MPLSGMAVSASKSLDSPVPGGVGAGWGRGGPVACAKSEPERVAERFVLSIKKRVLRSDRATGRTPFSASGLGVCCALSPGEEPSGPREPLDRKGARGQHQRPSRSAAAARGTSQLLSAGGCLIWDIVGVWTGRRRHPLPRRRRGNRAMPPYSRICRLAQLAQLA